MTSSQIPLSFQEVYISALALDDLRSFAKNIPVEGWQFKDWPYSGATKLLEEESDIRLAIQQSKSLLADCGFVAVRFGKKLDVDLH